MVIEPEPMASIIVPIHPVKRILARLGRDFRRIWGRRAPAGGGMAGDMAARSNRKCGDAVGRARRQRFFSGGLAGVPYRPASRIPGCAGMRAER